MVLKKVDAGTYTQIAKEIVEYKLKIDRFYATTLTTNYSWLTGVSTYGLIIMPTYIDEGYVTYTSGHLVLADEETDNSGETESDIKSIMLYQLAMDIYKAAKTVAKVVGLKLSKPEQPPKGTQFKPFLTNLCESYQTEIVNKCITP